MTLFYLRIIYIKAISLGSQTPLAASAEAL
jgi:hypothetical protein